MRRSQYLLLLGTVKTKYRQDRQRSTAWFSQMSHKTEVLLCDTKPETKLKYYKKVTKFDIT
jgi:hypothetical protein